MPYNCGRKCPFCESRKMYDTLNVSLDKTLEVLRRIADSDIEDIMITGGEPCDNLDYLGKMLDILKDKIVYVNTLFPSESAKDITHMFDVEYPCVKGINVSRHLSTYEKDSAFLYAPIPSCRWPKGRIRQHNNYSMPPPLTTYWAALRSRYA